MSIETVKDEQAYNVYQNHWPLSVCPESYEDMECNTMRTSLFKASGGCTIGKGIMASILCCLGKDCTKSCTFTWIGDGNCVDSTDCVTTVIQSSTTGLLGFACVLSLCAYVPCLETMCCFAKKKKKDQQPDMRIIVV